LLLPIGGVFALPLSLFLKVLDDSTGEWREVLDKVEERLADPLGDARRYSHRLRYTPIYRTIAKASSVFLAKISSPSFR
jgi:hypothetical protein